MTISETDSPKSQEGKFTDEQRDYHATAKLELEHIQEDLKRAIESRPFDKEPITADEARQVGQYLIYLYRHPGLVAKDIHDAWVGEKDLEDLEPRQYGFVTPYEKMGGQQVTEIEKTKGDVKGVYRALQKQGQLTGVLPPFDGSTIPTEFGESTEGLDGHRVMQVLGYLANIDSFVDAAAPFIHDTYLAAVARSKGETFTPAREGYAFSQLPQQTRLKSRTNVRLDIIALAGAAPRVIRMASSGGLA